MLHRKHILKDIPKYEKCPFYRFLKASFTRSYDHFWLEASFAYISTSEMQMRFLFGRYDNGPILPNHVHFTQIILAPVLCVINRDLIL